jgi:hypothetical protein
MWMCLSILPARKSALSNFSMWFVVKMMIRSLPHDDHNPSVKFNSPDKVTRLACNKCSPGHQYPTFITLPCLQMQFLRDATKSKSNLMPNQSTQEREKLRKKLSKHEYLVLVIFATAWWSLWIVLSNLLPGLGTLCKICRAIDILNNYNGAVGCLNQQFPKLGVRTDFCQFDVVYVILQIISYGCYHAGFPCSWWPIQKVPPLPCLPCILIKLLPFRELVKVQHDILLQNGLHCKRFKCRWVLEWHRFPCFLLVAENNHKLGSEINQTGLQLLNAKC